MTGALRNVGVPAPVEPRLHLRNQEALTSELDHAKSNSGCVNALDLTCLSQRATVRLGRHDLRASFNVIVSRMGHVMHMENT
jgi:hypothetical protein